MVMVRSAWACLRVWRGGVDALCFVLDASSTLLVVGAPAQFAGTTERMSLTVSKQIARQALRMEADWQKLETLRAEAGSYAPGGGQVVLAAGDGAVAASAVDVLGAGARGPGRKCEAGVGIGHY